MERRSTGFIAPLSQARSGRLVFLSGVFGVTLLADPLIPDLAIGHFTDPVPHVEASEGALVIHSRRFHKIDERVFLQGDPGEIRLNASIPWEIEFRGPLTGLNADLRGLQLRSLDVLGSASDIRLRLSRPAGTGFIYISGDVDQFSILRTQDSAVRLSAVGGIYGLALDDQYFTAIEGEARLESSDFTDSVDCYEIGIAGSARNVSIGKEVH